MPASPVADWAVAAGILYPVSTAAVALRLLAVRLRGAAPKLPEYLVVVAWLCQTGYLVDVSVAGLDRGGYGEHIASLSPARITSSLKAFWISQWFWAVGVNGFRLAILLLYVDIFRTDLFRWQAIVTAAVVIGYFCACILTICLLCLPLRSNWDLSVQGTCGNQVAIEYFSAAFNMLLDLWVVYLPLPTIWKLQLSPQKKWFLTASFSLGLGTAAANLGRLIQTLRCHTAADATFCFLNSSISVFAEFSSGILVACVPTLGSLLARRKKASSTPNKAHEASSDGRLRTIGSMQLRKYKRSNATTLGSSLFSRADSCAEGHDLADDTAALALRGTQMGHQTEICGSKGRSDSAGGAEGDQGATGTSIVRTVGYNVK